MWWLIHRKAKTRRVAGGRTLRETCPDCGAATTFREVERTEAIGVFFAVDLAKDRERMFQCDACGELFDLKDAPPAPGPTAPPRDLLEELERDKARREDERRRTEQRIDDELAALKKRLGR